MMLRQLSFLFLLALVPQFNLIAQVSFGGHPPSVKWLQIDTDNVRVIYPEGRSEQAKRIAGLINYLQEYHLETVGTRTKKIDLVLQTNQVISNGYVGLSPYRSEFYATPFQNHQIVGTADWLDELAIHEYRHALQFSNANRGATKVFHVLQGQGGWAGAMFLSVPNWYLEGDAVVSETVLTNSGRGRVPEFFKEQRALLLNGIDYSYMKARNGSYKDIVPSHYPLGYAITNYGRNHFGQDVWKNILADAGAYKTIIYPFSGAMNIHTGMRAPTMYKAAYSELKEQWNNELQELSLTKHNSITSKQKTVTNNQSARFLKDGSIVFLHSSFKQTPSIHLLHEGAQKKLTDIGSSVDSYITENNNQLAWTEYQRDPRWGNLNYTKVMLYDLRSGLKQTVAENTKLFSPQISGDGSLIVAARYTSELEPDIVLLNTATGNIDRVLQNSERDFISYPNWTHDDNAIIYIAKRGHEIAIYRYDLVTNKTIPLTEWTHHTIGSLSVGKDRVIFTSSYSGIDNIYSVDLDGSKIITQLTSARIGAYQPDISSDGKTIIFSEFTEKGYVLSSLDISDALQKKITPEEPVEMERFNIQLAEYEENILDKIPESDFESKPYKRFLKGTKLHDWGVSGGDSEVYGRLGFANILNDFNTFLYGGYNQNEEAFRYGVGIQYWKYFTGLNFSAFNSLRGTVAEGRTDSTIFIRGDVFEENKISAGFTIPLVYQRGNFTTGFTANVNFANYRLGNTFSFENEKASLTSFETQITFYNLRRRALQNVQSRLGQYILFSHSTSLTELSGKVFNIQAGLYLPGIGLNHGILIEAEYQKELLTNSYQYADFFNYARGYPYRPNDYAQRISFNYQLPLLYPDWGFFNFAYFKRVRLNAFSDLAKLEYENFPPRFDVAQASFGGELMIDTIMLNVLPVTFILRQSFLPDAFPGEPTSNFDFFISISL